MSSSERAASRQRRDPGFPEYRDQRFGEITASRRPRQACGIAAAIVARSEARFRRSLKELTVLAKQNDPFRLDTPANHKLGEWVGQQIGTAFRPSWTRGSSRRSQRTQSQSM